MKMLIKVKDNENYQICCICNNRINGYGNIAEPYKSGTCCDECNKKFVIPARIKQIMNKDKTGGQNNG